MAERTRKQFWIGLGSGIVLGVVLAGIVAIVAGPARKGVVTIDTNELGLIVETKLDHVYVDELASWIVEGRNDFVVIDIRTPKEYAGGHVPGAINVPLSQLGRADVVANRKIVLYSSGGIHAAQAWFFLKALGHKGAYTLFGGLEEWQDAYVNPELAPDASVEDKALHAKRVKLAAALAKLGK